MTKKFVEFVCFWMKNTLPVYMEYIGYEIMTILSGIYGDTDLVNAWLTLQSLVAVFYMLGVGFADTGRTFVGIQIGKKEFGFAKKLANWTIM